MKIYISLLLIFIPFLSFSQTYSFTVGGNFTSGNLLSYGLNLRSNINSNVDKVNQISFTPSFDYGNMANAQGQFKMNRRELLSIVNYERSKNKLKFYVYSEIENSYLRKIRIRGSLGTGFSIKIIKNEKTNFDISQLILPEIFESSFSNKRDNWCVRLSTRLRYSRTVNKFKYSGQILLQPAIYTKLTDGKTLPTKENTTIRVNNSYEFILSKNLSMGFMGELIVQTYTSFINPSVKPYDTNMNLFIKGNF